jgi:metal-responsive CopG/Arc/MetJ family transcriptional regulator
MNAKVSVSLPNTMLMQLDKLAIKWKTTRSGAVVELLKHFEQENIAREMAEGYAALSEKHSTDAELFLPAQAEVVNRDGC